MQVQVKAREIDFVTSFGKNLKALVRYSGELPGNDQEGKQFGIKDQNGKR